MAARITDALIAFLVLGLMPWASAHAVGNVANGATYFTTGAGAPGNNLCGGCHVTPQPNNATSAFSGYGNTANPLSVYGNPTTGAGAIATAPSPGYTIPAGNTSAYAAGTSTSVPMGGYAATLGSTAVPSQAAQDIQAYFASLFPTPVISSAATANAQVGTTYANFYTITASNSPASYSISAGTLPAGLSLNTSTGVISGTPTTAAVTSTVTIAAANAVGTAGTKSLTITVSPVITSAATASGTVGVNATQYSIVASNTPTGHSLSTGTLPTGTTLTGANVSGTPTAAGTFTPTLAASNAAGTGTLVVTFTIAKGSQTISFGVAPATVVVNTLASTGSVSATATSGLGVTYSSSTPGTCSVNAGSGAVIGLAAGTNNCTITAAQAGNANYNAATSVTQTFSVGLGSQVISFGAAPVVVVGSTGSVSATGGASTSAVILSVPTTTTICSISGTTLTGLAAGTCTVAANQTGDANYNAAPQNTLNITIGKGSQAITFGPAPTVLVNGTGTVSATGGASTSAVAFTSTTPSICSVTGTTVSGIAAGTCTIAANQAGDTNYNAAPQVTQNIAVGLNPQTITFGALPSITYPGTGTVSATGGASGNTVTFSIPVTTTICSVTGNVVTGLAAGTCTVAADQAGNTVYAAAPQTTANITINKAGQTVAFGAVPTVVVGGTGAVSATGGASGNPVTFSVPTTTTICSVSGTTVTGLAVGTCTVAANQASSANYNAAPQVTQNITVGQGSQIITFGAAPMISYLGTGTVSASTTSGLAVSFTSTTPSVCSITGTTVTGLAAGTCTIAANQAGDVNYLAATQVTQNFAIGQAGQTLAFGAAPGLVAGGTGTVSATGGGSGNAVTFTSTTPTKCSVTGTTVTGIAIGTCTIAANQAGTANYSAASQVTQNIIVGQGSQTITFGAAPGLGVGGTATVTATSSAGLAVTLTSTTTGICTISGTTVTGVAAGTCTIAANQAGDANYTAAVQVTQNITVTNLPPTAGAASLSTQLNTAATLDMVPFITGFGVTGVSVPTQPSHGAVSVSGTKVTYTPNKDYFGADTFKYLAYNAGGISPAPATVTVTVNGRPDPTKDARVTGLIAIQTATVKRFGTVQMFNFQQRLESRHHAVYNPMINAAPADAGNPPVPADPGTPPAPAGGTSLGQTQSYFNSWQPNTVLAYANEPKSLMLAPDRMNSVGGSGSAPMFGLLMNAVTNAITTSSLNLGAISNVVGAAQDDSFARLDIWAAGNLRFGTNTQAGTNTQFSTDGISVGADKRLDRKLTVGMGMGYARDQSSVGTDGTNSTSSGNSVAAYASYQMDSGTFLDGLLGYGKVNFITNRYVPAVNDFARASRTGDQLFGSLSFGYEYRREALLWSPYGRYDYAFDRLNAGTESGAGANALNYASQDMRSSHLAFGMRGQSAHQTTFGVVQPHARLEYQRSLESTGQTSVAYADLPGVQYAVTGTSQNSNALVLGLGSDFLLSDTLKFAFDYQRLHSNGFENYQSINFRLTKTLSGKNDLAELLEESYDASLDHPSGLIVAAGFAYDDNVSRASEVLDKLSDTIYSLTVSKGLVFPVSRHTRLTVSGFMDVEKFRNYAGLGHVSGGMQGEYMYRNSGEFGAPTYGIFARFEADQYESTLRDGTHSSAGLTLRKPLTDRVDLFAAVAENAHTGKSDVFNTRDVSGRVNLDYALASGQTIYLTGEYRKGDIISSGQPSLKILDIATVLVRDDVFTSAGFYDYRMKGQTVLFTLGYNIGFGNKDSADVSWRRVQSTPDMTPAYASPLRYTVNQLSILYLMAF